MLISRTGGMLPGNLTFTYNGGNIQIVKQFVVLLWWFFLFYVLVFKIFWYCWRLMCVFIVLVKLR